MSKNLWVGTTLLLVLLVAYMPTGVVSASTDATERIRDEFDCVSECERLEICPVDQVMIRGECYEPPCELGGQCIPCEEREAGGNCEGVVNGTTDEGGRGSTTLPEPPSVPEPQTPQDKSDGLPNSGATEYVGFLSSLVGAVTLYLLVQRRE